MRITNVRSDGSLDATPDLRDGMIQTALCNAQKIAEMCDTVVHFRWVIDPITVAADSDLWLILRQWEYNVEHGDRTTEVGPHPDPTTTPKFTHSTHATTM